MQSAITQFRLGLETVAIIGIYYKNTYTAFSPSSQEKKRLYWKLMQSIAQSQQAILFFKLHRACFLGALARTIATTLWECASVVRECASVVKEWAPVVKDCTSVVKECASVAKNRLM